MANAAAKAREENNRGRLNGLLAALLLSAAWYFLMRFARATTTTWHKGYAVACALGGAMAYRFLQAAAEGGADIAERSKTGGAISYAHDAIYVAVATLVLAAITPWAFGLLLLPWGFLAYLGWTHILKPWIFTPTERERPETPAEKKAREKRERRERKWGR